MNPTCCIVGEKPTHRTPLIDRIKVWWQNFKCRKTARAYRDLQKALSEDPVYRHTWLCNIAMPIYDATRPKCSCGAVGDYEHHSKCQILQSKTIPRRFECRDMSIEQANYIAERLLNHMFPKQQKPK